MMPLWKSQSRAFIGTLVSFLVLARLQYVNDSPTGDLSHTFTDHLHHAFAAWAFLFRGLKLYTEPFGQATAGILHPHAFMSWEHMPMAYPPGVFFVFLPPALIGRFISMTDVNFVRWTSGYILLLGHTALYASWKAIERSQAGARSVVALFVWLAIGEMGMQGFYDPLYIGCGGMLLYHLRRNEPEKALYWFAGAAFLHYRAIVTVPAAAAALYQLAQKRKIGRAQILVLCVVTISCACCLYSFHLMYPVAKQFHDVQKRALDTPVKEWMAISVSLIVMGYALLQKDLLVAATIALCLGIALVEVQPYWWHAAILLFPMMCVGTFKEIANPSGLRAATIGWLMVLQPLAWESVVHFIVDFKNGFHINGM